MIKMKKRGGTTEPSPTCNEVIANANRTHLKLQALKNIAYNQAMRCRWDPALGKAHLEYYNFIEDILNEYS